MLLSIYLVKTRQRSAVGWALKMWSTGYRYNSQLHNYAVSYSHTLLPQSPSSVSGIGKSVMILRGWEVNCRFGIALPMRYRAQWSNNNRLKWVRERFVVLSSPAPQHALICASVDCWWLLAYWAIIRMCKKAEMSKQKVDPLSQRNNSFVSSHDVWRYITDSGITTVSWWWWWCDISEISHCRCDERINRLIGSCFGNLCWQMFASMFCFTL